MRRIALLIPATLMLLAPVPRTAFADVVITDPAVGPTTAEIDGVAATVDPALTINISTRFLDDGTVNWSVYPSLAQPNSYGPVWIAAIEGGGVFCDFGGCSSGRFGWHNVGGPLDADPSFGGLDLSGRVGDQAIVTRTPASTTVRILTPPPLMRAETLGDLFAYLQAWFAGGVSETPVEYLGRWFAR